VKGNEEESRTEEHADKTDGKERGTERSFIRKTTLRERTKKVACNTVIHGRISVYKSPPIQSSPRFGDWQPRA